MSLGWPKKIVLVRHGESEGNVLSDNEIATLGKANHEFSLTEKGKKQAQDVGRVLDEKYKNFDSCFCSTYARTQETQSLAYPRMRPVVDSRLDELWGGVWHTMHREKVPERYPEEVHIQKREGRFHHRPPGGQSCSDVELMIHSFLLSLRVDYADKEVLVFAHGDWMLLFWRIMQNATVGDLYDRMHKDRYENCAIVEYVRGDSGMVPIEVPAVS